MAPIDTFNLQFINIYCFVILDPLHSLNSYIGYFEKERDKVVNRHLSIESSFFQRCNLMIATVCVYKLSNVLQHVMKICLHILLHLFDSGFLVMKFFKVTLNFLLLVFVQQTTIAFYVQGTGMHDLDVKYEDPVSMVRNIILETKYM